MLLFFDLVFSVAPLEIFLSTPFFLTRLRLCYSLFLIAKFQAKHCIAAKTNRT